LLMDSESNRTTREAGVVPRRSIQRPPFAFDHLPHLSCNALIGVAVTRQKKLAAAKNKVTVGSRKVDCKKKTRLDTFFDPAPAKFAARSPASHVTPVARLRRLFDDRPATGGISSSLASGAGPQPQPSCGSHCGRGRVSEATRAAGSRLDSRLGASAAPEPPAASRVSAPTQAENFLRSW